MTKEIMVDGIAYVKKEETAPRGILPDKCVKAITLIQSAFVWSSTKEGKEYWQEVCNKLDSYSKGN